MSQEEYIKTHPEQFKDDIDKWLFIEFGIIGGCCSAEKSHEYHIARMVVEKLTDVFIEKACEWIKEKWDDNYTMPIIIDSVIDEFKTFMKVE